MARTARALAAGLLVATVASGCSLGGDDSLAPTSAPPRWQPARSLTGAGQELAATAAIGGAPSYDLRADVAPDTGTVRGTLRADLPVGDADEVRMRYFAGMPDLEARARLGPVEVDRTTAEASVDEALVRIPLPDEHGDRVRVTVPFSYRLPLSEPGGGLLDALGGLGGPADVGLLSRRPDAVSLGHWFPLWIPSGNRADPVPGGFGDIGNSPAALIRMSMTVPDTWQVVDGGVRTSSDSVGGERTVTSEGYGMNDLVVSVLKDYDVRARKLDGDLSGVTVRVYGPRNSEADLAGVLDEATTSLEVLSAAFTHYPWREFDVISAPLGSGVAGMEWPGATWIESSLFAGGVPGLAGMEGLLGGAGGLDDLLDGLGGDLGGLAGGETGRMLATMRRWTIAHEVGHEWWHILVGNDSITAPAVDEPLAQLSACLVLRDMLGSSSRTDDLCDAHIESGYEQMRLLGEEDAPADRATDEYASSLQYAGVVYGKAAAFYRELEDQLGRQAVTAALSEVTQRHAFDMLSLDGLHDALATELEDPAFDRAWRRWMHGTHGDQDLQVDPGAGAGGGLGGQLGSLLDQLAPDT